MATTNLGAPLRLGGAAGRPYPDFGAETSAVYVYNIVPLTASATNLRTASAVGGSGALVLAAGTGVTLTTVNGVSRYVLDVPRALRYVSSGNDTGITFTASGYDVYGVPMTETVTGANASTANGKKAFYSITGITASGAAAGTVSIGTTDILGIPYAMLDKGYCMRAGWNTTLAADAGTLVTADTAVATATTGDVRGTYTPSSASDGTKRLVFGIFLPDVDTLNAVTTTGTSLYGRAQA